VPGPAVAPPESARIDPSHGQLGYPLIEQVDAAPEVLDPVQELADRLPSSRAPCCGTIIAIGNRLAMFTHSRRILFDTM
jgi:hypothetical protein